MTRRLVRSAASGARDGADARQLTNPYSSGELSSPVLVQSLRGLLIGHFFFTAEGYTPRPWRRK